MEPFRRRSEGSEPAATATTITTSVSATTGPGIGGRVTPTRRVSFHSSPVLRCRYSRCGRIALAASDDGLAFKNCHNCSYTYCSRACRRAHWEKHRKTCLFSRVGSLCRQVIAAAKEQHDTLLHLSVIARRGYLSHGLGAVKCFFPCPESAEKFLKEGLDALGEITYVQWPDLLPSEMGSQLYTELVKMCKNYNPDSKLVLYVSVCVVSEAPAAGAVKWERQLVSRCAKMRLSKDIPIPEREHDNPETLILTCKYEDDDGKRLTSNTLETRRISFENIQKHLRQRGVSLKRQYPDIFKLLNEYVNGNCDKFKPVTVYPRDAETGKTFMCIIMPDADPDSLKQVIDVGVKVRSIDVLNE